MADFLLEKRTQVKCDFAAFKLEKLLTVKTV